MANHALVIGCDRYRDPALTLQGAERDAREMRRWLLDPDGGDVPRQNLHALYSPERAEIVVALDRLMRAGRGDEGRLFFYFAGHGLTATADGYDEPCLLPADFTPGYRDPAMPIRDLCEQLSAAWLTPQFVFIDACRGVPQDSAFRARGLSDRRPRDYDRPEPDQYVRFATGPAALAYETGTGARAGGVFTAALLQGLRGAGSAKRWDPDAEQYVVRMRELFGFVGARLLTGGVTQVPRALDRYGDPNPALARFPEDAFDPVTLRVSITPAEAAAGTTLGALGPADRISHPPLDNPVTLRLAPRTYSLRAHATGYLPRRRSWSVDLYDDSTVEVALDPGHDAAVPPWVVRPPGRVERCSPARALRPAAPPPGTVTELQDEAGAVRLSSVAVVVDRPGRYLLRILQPSGAGPQRPFEVPTDGDEPPVLPPPAPVPAAPDPAAGLHLAADGWWADDTGLRLPPLPPGPVAALAALRRVRFTSPGVLVVVTGAHRQVTVGTADRDVPPSVLTPGPGGTVAGFLPCPPGPVVVTLTGLFPAELRVAAFAEAAPDVVVADVSGAPLIVHGVPQDVAALVRAEAAQRFAGQGRRAEAAAVLRSGPAGLPGLVLAGLLAAARGAEGVPDLRRSSGELATWAPGLPDAAVLASLAHRSSAPPPLTGVPIMAAAAVAALRRYDDSPALVPALLREAVPRLLPEHAATAWLAPSG